MLAGVAGNELFEAAAALRALVAARVASTGFVGMVLAVGSLNVPPVGMIEGSKLRGSLTCFSHFNFRTSNGGDSGALVSCAFETPATAAQINRANESLLAVRF